MFEPPKHRYQVSFDDDFLVANAPTKPPADTDGKKKLKKALRDEVDVLADLQRVLYADNRHALLLIFQALDAAGKDSTIRAVTSGVDPAGFQVFSFKQPSSEDLDHDFLWRSARRLPERGRIGIFNRSYYEEVLVVRAHPNFLDGQRLPHRPPLEQLWHERFESIRDHEKHLARNGTVILKFWLNVSKEEQRDRFVARIDEPEKNWKFSANDVRERGFWDTYMEAYQDTLRATSRPWAPWYSIPADDKPYMRLTVARIIRQALEAMDLRYPELDQASRDALQDHRALLMAGDE